MKVKIKGKWFKVELVNGIDIEYIKFSNKNATFEIFVDKALKDLTVEDFASIVKELNN